MPINLIFFIIIILFTQNSFAQEKNSSFTDWDVYQAKIDNRDLCYVASYPKARSGNYQERSPDKQYVFVTSLSKDVDEFSTSSGYKYKDGSEVKLTIDDVKISLFTKGENAWASDNKQDAKIVNLMKNKSKMSIFGISRLGTWSKDEYSLSGFSAAYNKMKQLCNHQ